MSLFETIISVVLIAVMVSIPVCLIWSLFSAKPDPHHTVRTGCQLCGATTLRTVERVYATGNKTVINHGEKCLSCGSYREKKAA